MFLENENNQDKLFPNVETKLALSSSLPLVNRERSRTGIFIRK
jgi:hypothetical protein